MQILALQRDWTGAQPASETIVLTLGQKRFVRNLRDGAEVFADTLTVTLEAVVPTLLVLASERLPPPTVAISSKAGELRLAGSPGEVVHLDFIDSRGEIARRYSGNTVLRDGSAIWPVPITGS